MTSPLKTPLWDWHVAHNAKMAPFAGWDMPIQYKGIVAEHMHTREKASVFDICHMAEFIIKGPGAGDALAKIVTHNIATLKPGRCRYGFMLNENGGIIDDLIVYHVDTDHYMLVVNAACRTADVAAVQKHISGSVTFTDESDNLGKIDLQGPTAVDAFERILPGPWRQMPYFSLLRAEFEGAPLIVSRTGYTGELGFELYVPMEKTLALWEACLADKDVEPAGLGARDTLRLEAGLPLYGQDLDTAHTPAEAGYGAMLTSEADYVGKARAFDVRQKLVPLSIACRRSARHNDPVILDGKEVGTITSGSFSPSLGQSIALAYIAAEYADADMYTVTASKTELPATRVSLPFYTKGTARMKLS